MASLDAGRAASRELRRVGWFLHAHMVETKFQALRYAVENKYDLNQPRVPAGNPDGGQWTDGGGGGGRLPSGPGTLIDVDDSPSERIRLAQNDPPDHLSDVVPRPKKLPRDIQSVSDIPKEKPDSIQLGNAIIKFVAYELADYIMTRAERPLSAGTLRSKLLRRFMIGFEIARWVRDEGLPAIESYSDPPRTLEELQEAAASGTRPGYEIHHIVELNSKQPGEDTRINSRENLVRIPKFKHHQITGFYKGRADAYQQRPPREVLRGTNWDTRYRAGLKALVDHGVLKP